MDKTNWLQGLAQKYSADAVLVTDLKNVRWLSGFSGSNGCLVFKGNTAHFITDRRYANVVQDEVKNAEIHIYSGGSIFDELARLGLLEDVQTCAIESRSITIAEHRSLKSTFANLEYVEIEQDFNSARSIKNDFELSQIRAAQSLAEEAFDQILGVIKPGVSESEIAAEIVYLLLSKGAERTSFDPIVASGPNGAKPHAKPGSRLIESGDLIVIDFGCVLNGYCSDMTRTIGIGELDSEEIKVHQTVLDAMRSAIDHVRDGRLAHEVDKVARDYISHRGYARYFTHSTGHGVGLDIHEIPSVSSSSSDRLAEGNVITIEPGIYIPDRFGVRIEDMVYVNKLGSEVITRAARELIVL